MSDAIFQAAAAYQKAKAERLALQQSVGSDSASWRELTQARNRELAAEFELRRVVSSQGKGNAA